MTMMAKNPFQRYQAPEEVADALAALENVSPSPPSAPLKRAAK